MDDRSQGFRDRSRDIYREYVDHAKPGLVQDTTQLLIVFAFIIVILGGLSLALFGFGLLT